MEIIRSLVQDLIVIVILAMFLEMLLPAGEMRKFVKMVMGLLIIVAVVQAVGELARWDDTGDLPALTGEAGPEQLAAIMESGRRMAQAQEQKAIEQYRQGLANQVVALAGMNGAIPVTGAEVTVNTERDASNYGQIEKITLLVAKEPAAAERRAVTGKPAAIAPVTVQIGPEPEPEAPAGTGQGPPEAEVTELVRTVANFYNLKQEQVQCMYR